MQKTPGGYKRIVFDVLGVLLILAGLAFGWLPGPGGIPLVLAGLGLLSINNHWAKRLIKYFDKYSNSARLLIFPNNKIVKLAHDLVAIFIFLIAIWLIAFMKTPFSIGIGISCLAIAMAEVLFNHNLVKKIK